MTSESPEAMQLAIQSVKIIRKAEKIGLSQQFVGDAAGRQVKTTKEEMKAAILDEVSKVLDQILEGVSEETGIGYSHGKLDYGHTITLVPLLADGRLADDSADARKSELTTAWKIAVFRRDGYKCINGCKSKDIHAHHKIAWSESPEKRFDVDNGETLCVDCHAAEHPEIANLIKSSRKGESNGNRKEEASQSN